jgi:hypothetical protein
MYIDDDDLCKQQRRLKEMPRHHLEAVGRVCRWECGLQWADDAALLKI